MNEEDTTSLRARHARRETSDGSSGLGRARDAVATRMREAAHMLDERAEQDDLRNERLAQFERNAARTFQMWSERMDEWDVDRLDRRVRSYVREQPAASLLTAAAIGLCIGLWMRKR